MAVALSEFANSLTAESAFTVLALAKQLKATGKDVVELEIGDSPFNSPAAAQARGLQAITDNVSHYCPSPGIPQFREAAAAFVRSEYGIPATAENIGIGQQRPTRRAIGKRPHLALRMSPNIVHATNITKHN